MVRFVDTFLYAYLQGLVQMQSLSTANTYLLYGMETRGKKKMLIASSNFGTLILGSFVDNAQNIAHVGTDSSCIIK
jgi:hypothetical protein